MAKNCRHVMEDVILELVAIGELSYFHPMESAAAYAVYPYPYDWPSIRENGKYAIVTIQDLTSVDPKKIAHDVIRQWVEKLGEESWPKLTSPDYSKSLATSPLQQGSNSKTL